MCFYNMVVRASFFVGPRGKEFEPLRLVQRDLQPNYKLYNYFTIDENPEILNVL